MEDGLEIQNTKPADAPREPAPGGGPSPAEKRFLILLVEDHEDTRRAMERLLRRWGHAVYCAGNVAQALDIDSANAYDILLSDLDLPDGTGNELLIKLRERHPMRAVALSGHGRDADRARTQEAGFVEHLTKPVAMERLKKTIQRVGSL